MSNINKVLSQLAEQQKELNDAISVEGVSSASKVKTIRTNFVRANFVRANVVRANVEPIKSSRLAWAIGGFALSLGIGAWAVNDSPAIIQTSVVSSTQNDPRMHPMASAPALSKNTNKVMDTYETTIYESPKVERPAEPTSIAKISAPAINPHTQDEAFSATQINGLNSTSITTAKVETGNSSIHIQQVELTHKQMANKALARAKKALDANDFAGASNELATALRYTPKDENTRRKLAALYYGNRQIRKSADLLEEGIKLNKNSNELRIALANILLKENQPEAALSALGYLPDKTSNQYLAMRAALAQRLKNNDMAKQSYQFLTKRDPENGRWWLGLGIQQERDYQLSAAQESYTKAMSTVGLSSQSQTFVQSRLSLLSSSKKENKSP
ncbi:MAG: tetratricopeptide repeat protein [Vibrio sp.]